MKRALTITKRGDRDLVMTREFDAPRKLVYDAHTKPDLVRQWLLGPPGWTMPVCDMDVRVGGTYRWVWRKETGGSEMGMGGVYREIAKPERLVSTEKFDDPWYEGEALDTLVLIEQGGKTTATLTMLCATPEARNAVLKSGMDGGVAQSYDVLDKVLASIEGEDNRDGYNN